jgi:hypothetical protein
MFAMLMAQEKKQPLGALPVGALVRDPDTKYYGAPIVWRVADKNHAGYPANSVTLITDKIIKLAAFDQAEANNADANRKAAGNGRWRTSNIRQWLNSGGAAGAWWTAQNLTDGVLNTNNADAKPNTQYNRYDTEAGFLTKFSPKLRAALLPTTLITARNTVTDGGGSDTTTDKIFLASYTEAYGGRTNNIPEGARLACFTDAAARVAYTTPEAAAANTNSATVGESGVWFWFLRSIYSANLGSTVAEIERDGSVPSVHATYTIVGIRPCCNLPSATMVSGKPDKDGVYTIK